MKKLLLLGGISYLIPVIKAAKKLGYYVITCDYLPDNSAHKYSDEFHNVSILDKEAVLMLAQSLQIDGIMSFAVDPGVVTAAYVADKMNLPIPGSYESVKILQNKGLFRQFLKEHNFNVPKSSTYSDMEQAINEFDDADLPVIVKPVDSAGSKGVSKVNAKKELKRAIEYALQFSATKTFIIEEFLEGKGFSSDTDCFSINGELTFVSFSNQRFDANAANPYTPSAYSWPSGIAQHNQTYLKNELQRLISLLEMKSSVYNIEVRETTDNNAYIMEVSPRGGGNRLSEMLHYATGVDLISRAIQAAMGEKVDPISPAEYDGNWAIVVLYSNVQGIFKKLKIAEEIKEAVVEVELRIDKGDKVNVFSAANDAIGTVVLQMADKQKLEEVLADYPRFFQVLVEDSI
ncbi:MAG TPA: ATP-grasp domain-containing protein [Salinimicrobium sp.]|nr:ATP-grasp domain-containing protein [Salinimicrobium sp.]